MRYPEMLAGLVLSGGCTGMSEAGPEEREAFRVSREVPLNAGQVPADFATVSYTHLDVYKRQGPCHWLCSGRSGAGLVDCA